MNGKPRDMNFHDPLKRKLGDKLSRKLHKGSTFPCARVPIDRPQMADIQHQSTGRLFNDKAKEAWNGDGSCYKVGQGWHFEQHQWSASVTQYTGVIKNALD